MQTQAAESVSRRETESHIDRTIGSCDNVNASLKVKKR